MIDVFPRATHHRLLDLKQGQNKQGQTILYLVFEYMDTDLKKYIRSFRQNRDMIPPKTIKVTSYATKRTVSSFYYMLQTIDSLPALLLGTPSEEVWPGVDRLSNWHEYPKWSPKSLSSAVPNLDADGLDLLSVSVGSGR
ncbi:hypothetical protein BHE74_00027626 [Ensete ventricosum]|nr:hypothetical protein GW17_00023855 [Ensete ventricosum]RWW65089.1 hypothetical protein BHE74_00027626 [Ensete ventricosum]RZR98998.1 hypothetical protein BHM03_00028465 [Ensete ventricosum]